MGGRAAGHASARFSASQGPGSSPPKPELVLFDLDETLFDDDFARRAGLTEARRLDPALRSHPLDTLYRWYGELLNASHRAGVDGRAHPDGMRLERFRALGARAGVSWTAQALTEVVKGYRSAYERAVRPVPGAGLLLDHLRGRNVQIGIVSNNRTAEQAGKLRAIGLDTRVDFLVTSEATGFWKPDPRIFMVALERASVPASRTVMIGDSWNEDVLGARAAGIRPVWFNRFGRSRPPGDEAALAVRALWPPGPALTALGLPRQETTGSAVEGPSPSRYRPSGRRPRRKTFDSGDSSSTG